MMSNVHKMFMDIADFEDLFDSALLGAIMFGFDPLPNTPNLGIQLKNVGWTDYYEFSMWRLKILAERGFINNPEMYNVHGEAQGKFATCFPLYSVSDKVKRAFEEGVVNTPSEMFNPSEEQRVLLMMYDITPTKVLD